MTAVEPTTALLEHGQHLSPDEFIRRWEAMPNLKFAELLGGVVHLASPLSKPHRDGTVLLNRWLLAYADATEGCDSGANATWKLPTGDIPQPDGELIILPEYGGQTGVDGLYCAGPPELVAEVAVTTAAKDLGEKRWIYQRAGVHELIVLQPLERRLHWFDLRQGDATIQAGEDGVLRSRTFPGLWLHLEAVLAGDKRRLMRMLNEGLVSREHADFAAELERRRAT